jgi:hypothetical protein
MYRLSQSNTAGVARKVSAANRRLRAALLHSEGAHNFPYIVTVYEQPLLCSHLYDVSEQKVVGSEPST